MNYNFQRFYENHDAVPGWYGREGVAMSEFFLGLTRFPELGMVGDIAEIGVFEGRSALHLGMHVAAGEKLHLFDIYDKMPLVAELVQASTAGTVVGQRLFSQLIDETIIPSNSCRYIRIDGNHTRRAVWDDMGIADRILRQNGVVNLDDFFNPVFFGVTHAVLEWISLNPKRFDILLVGHSQAYLCRPSYTNFFMNKMRGLPEHLRSCGIEDFSLCRASGPSDCITVGITHRMHDRDWLMSETDYANVTGPEGRVLEV